MNLLRWFYDFFFPVYYKDTGWLDPPILENIKEDQDIYVNTVFTGDNNCTLILQNDADVLIEGNLNGEIITFPKNRNTIRITGSFDGHISGHNQATIRVEGTFNGSLSCSLLFVKETGKVEGSIVICQKLWIEPGAQFEVNPDLS